MIKEEQRQLKEKFLELEYNTLRKEIETSRDRHFRILAGALFAIPAVQIVAQIVDAGGSGTTTVPNTIALVILLLLPVVLLTLCRLYFCERLAIERCARYIREHIEEVVEGVKGGWETWLEEGKDKGIRALEDRQTSVLALLYGLLFLVAVFLAGQQAYIVFSGLFSNSTAAVVGGWIAVGVVVLLYGLALWYARDVVQQLMQQLEPRGKSGCEEPGDGTT